MRLVISARSQETQPATEAEAEIATALERTWEQILTNAACPQDPDQVTRLVEGFFPMLNPRITDRERRKDPAFLAAEVEASSILRPAAVAEQLMQDPNFAKRQEEALKNFTRDLKPLRVSPD